MDWAARNARKAAGQNGSPLVIAPRLCAAAAMSLVGGWACVYAADLSAYRGFRLGQELAIAGKHNGVDPSQVRVMGQRPSVVQSLDWKPVARDADRPDPVRGGTLLFRDGRLFRIVISYDPYMLEGLTSEDLISNLSKAYGAAIRPGARIAYPAPFRESLKVLSRWEDSQHVCELLESDEGSFALVLYAKLVDVPALAEGTAEQVDAIPQQEVEAQKQWRGEADALLRKSRLANLENFRP